MVDDQIKPLTTTFVDEMTKCASENFVVSQEIMGRITSYQKILGKCINIFFLLRNASLRNESFNYHKNARRFLFHLSSSSQHNSFRFSQNSSAKRTRREETCEAVFRSHKALFCFRFVLAGLS